MASVVPAAPMEVGDEEKSPPPPPVQRRKRRVAAEKARQVIKKLKIDDTQGERDDEYSPCKHLTLSHTRSYFFFFRYWRHINSAGGV